jgi:hypothetical protein
MTGAVAVGVALALVSMMWPRIEGTARALVPFAGGSVQEAVPLLLMAGLALIAAPIAFYLAVPRD